MTLNLIKLCVGCDTVEELVDWHHSRGGREPWILHTRQTPKRGEELTQGGSLYRVFKGYILCRQRIFAVSTVGAGDSFVAAFVLALARGQSAGEALALGTAAAAAAVTTDATQLCRPEDVMRLLPEARVSAV